MVVKGNPVVHSSHPDEVGHGSVEVDVATWTDLQPHGAVTNSAGFRAISIDEQSAVSRAPGVILLSMMQKAELQL